MSQSRASQVKSRVGRCPRITHKHKSVMFEIGQTTYSLDSAANEKGRQQVGNVFTASKRYSYYKSDRKQGTGHSENVPNLPQGQSLVRLLLLSTLPPYSPGSVLTPCASRRTRQQGIGLLSSGFLRTGQHPEDYSCSGEPENRRTGQPICQCSSLFSHARQQPGALFVPGGEQGTGLGRAWVALDVPRGTKTYDATAAYKSGQCAVSQFLRAELARVDPVARYNPKYPHVIGAVLYFHSLGQRPHAPHPLRLGNGFNERATAVAPPLLAKRRNVYKRFCPAPSLAHSLRRGDRPAPRESQVTPVTPAGERQYLAVPNKWDDLKNSLNVRSMTNS
ncbi:hypothetical protein DPEC_G00272420 [Dallia pectoralis]|uniref:Uncharacterized protein n=1 Tax=Dallia pectoralis TaxID=75939 RepID=A0ACC2FQ39_DALPE|nr:hypothetical protein DPEC_G00272420 [Dallia pectoralis]